MSDDNKWDVLRVPPPQLFFNQKERDFVKQISDEVIEKIIGQQIIYYPISLEHTNFHPLYGEAIKKVFYNPLHVYVLVDFTDNPTETTNFGTDQTSEILIHFHKRRLNEDQNLVVKAGDFVAYGSNYYEIVQTFEPKELFGQSKHKIEISARCLKARCDLFTVG